MRPSLNWQLLKAFQRKGQSSSIQRIDLSEDRLSRAELLRDQLHHLDLQMAEIGSKLVQAEVVSFRSMLSGRPGWFADLKRRAYGSAAQHSANWHRNRLVELSSQRREIQSQLDRVTGQYWPKKIRAWLAWLLILVALIAVLIVMVMGLVMAVYLLPIWLMAIVVYWFLQGKRR